jgi:hypothetical protein
MCILQMLPMGNDFVVRVRRIINAPIFYWYYIYWPQLISKKSGEHQLKKSEEREKWGTFKWGTQNNDYAEEVRTT